MFGLPDALQDDLFGRLGGNAAEDLGRVHLYMLAERGMGIAALRLTQRDFLVGVVHLRNHTLGSPDTDVAVLFYLDTHVLPAAVGLAVGREQRVGHSLHHHILRQPLFVDELSNSGLKFGQHAFPPSGRLATHAGAVGRSAIFPAKKEVGGDPLL